MLTVFIPVLADEVIFESVKLSMISVFTVSLLIYSSFICKIYQQCLFYAQFMCFELPPPVPQDDNSDGNSNNNAGAKENSGNDKSGIFQWFLNSCFS